MHSQIFVWFLQLLNNTANILILSLSFPLHKPYLPDGKRLVIKKNKHGEQNSEPG
jgi:hypothetical protein